jgi:hypothetical protein
VLTQRASRLVRPPRARLGTPGTLKKLKGGPGAGRKEISEEQLAKIKAAIVQEWQRYKGMTADDARLAYMDEIHGWNGYGRRSVPVCKQFCECEYQTLP